MSRPVCLLGLCALILLHSSPAVAGHDEEMALTGVITRAHDRLEATGLRRMMSPAERARFDKARVAEQFERHLSRLGITQLVRCALVPQDPGEASGPLDEYRCQVSCQHGSYAVRVLMSPPVADGGAFRRPGHIERLWLASPLLDRTPWPWFPRGLAPLWLALVWGLTLLLCASAALRLVGVSPSSTEGAELSPAWFLARQQLVLFLRVLPALAVAVLGLLWWRFGPLPLWGRLLHGAALLGLLALGLGLLLRAVADFLHGTGPSSLWPSVLLALLLPGLSGWLLTGSTLLPPGSPGAAAGAGQVRCRLPLDPAQGPAYVRRSDGPLLELVYQHADGRSCRGRMLADCRSLRAPVLAPADGVIEQVSDGAEDQAPGQRDREHPAGNYVIVRHGPSAYSLLTHLLRGSVAVRAGQAVRAGDLLGRLGNSGDSDEPHLSLEHWAAPQPLPGRRPEAVAGAAFEAETATALPVVFSRYRLFSLFGSEEVEAGTPQAGQRLLPQ